MSQDATPEGCEYILSFTGPINQPATTSLRNCCCEAVNRRFAGITMLFASGGGSAEDGLALYEFLRALPIPLRMHAVGLVGSIAIPVFLAGEARTAAPSARFLFHGFTWNYGTPQTLSVDMMAEHAAMLGTAVDRVKAIVQDRTQNSHTGAEIEDLFSKPRIEDAAYAAERRLIQEVQEFRVPANALFLNVNW